MSYCIINRRECRELKEMSEPLLIYGRRKTGKTWLAKHCIKHEAYVLITREATCLVGEDLYEQNLSDCMKYITSLLSGNKTVIIDEFQRIPRKTWIDSIAHKLTESNGRIVLLGSSLGVLERVFAPHSPLLGLVEAYYVDLADPRDTVKSLVNCGMDPSYAVRWIGLARDPWILGLLKPWGEPVDMLYNKARHLAPIAPGLIGEVFAEEGRSPARVYDAILRLLAKGYWNTSQIALSLYNNGLIDSPAQSAVTGYIRNLERMGLVKGVRLWRTRGARIYYRHRSTLLSVLYYALESVDELGQEPNKDSLRSRYYVELQFDLAELLAYTKNLRPAYHISPAGWDIDILLVDRNGRPVWGYEVKSGPMNPAEARRAVARIRSLGIPKVGLLSLSDTPPSVNGADEVLGPMDIASLK